VPRLSLNYPNGRTHVLDYDGPETFHVGTEFELYGRRWRVSYIERPRDSRYQGTQRLLTCIPLTGSALGSAGADNDATA
jgi:hypothetical protein